jgi:methylglutaconyl-CoA hydratase
MSEQMIAELSALAADLRESAVQVVVLAAQGRSFCAGGDLKWM